jgi:hypothetical protein
VRLHRRRTYEQVLQAFVHFALNKSVSSSTASAVWSFLDPAYEVRATCTSVHVLLIMPNARVHSLLLLLFLLISRKRSPFSIPIRRRVPSTSSRSRASGRPSGTPYPLSHLLFLSEWNAADAGRVAMSQGIPQERLPVPDQDPRRTRRDRAPLRVVVCVNGRP